MDDIGGEAHVDSTGLDFLQLRSDNCQVLRVIDLRAEKILHIESVDIGCTVQLIQSILSVNLCLLSLAELDDLTHPDLPVFFIQFI